MKKIIMALVGVLLLSGFCACQKEQLGVYNPKMKINKIYSEEDGRYLLEEWTWTGNTLSKIDFFRPSGNLQSSQQYVYDGNRLSRIESDGQYTEFLYDGDLLTKINTYSGGNLTETYALTFEKNKLSHISYQKPSKGLDGCTLLPMFLPGNDEWIRVTTAGRSEKAEAYNFRNAEIDYVWEGDNVKYMKMQITRPDSIQQLTFTYVYDHNLNPKNGLFSLSPVRTLLNDHPRYLFCSQNNATSVMVTDSYDIFSKTTSFTYSYEYYNKYPTKVYSTSLNIETFGSDSTLIYTYEYLY